MAVEGFFEPLPQADGEFPVRRGKFIDVEVYGNLFAATGTFTSVTIDDATITDASISGTTTINDAILTNVTIQADLKSSNWDGASDDLSGGSVAASTGYLLDYSAGAAQFQNIYAEGGDLGALNVTDTLTMGAGGAIRTAATGQRIEITNTDNNLIKFYSGDADEIITGSIAQATNGAGVTRTLQFGTFTPKIEHTVASQVDAGGAFVVRSGSPDGSSFAPGFVFSQASAASGGGQTLQFRIESGIPLLTDGDVTLSAGDLIVGTGGTLYEPSTNVLGVKSAGGTRLFSISASAVVVGDAATTGTALMETAAVSASYPAYSFYGDDNTGMYRYAADAVGMATNATHRWRVQTPTSDGNAYLRNSGVVVVDAPTLGGTAGNITRAMSWYMRPSGNAVNLEVQAVRETTGTTHTGMAVGFRRITDNTSQSNLWFTASGVTINTTENISGATLAVNGTVIHKPNTTGSTNSGQWVNTTGSYYEWRRNTSTRRHKFDIDYDPKWAEAYANVKLPPLTRHGRIDADTEDERFIGWIAEDLHKAEPRLVNLDEGGLPESPDLAQIVMVLAAKIERLEAALNV